MNASAVRFKTLACLVVAAPVVDKTCACGKGSGGWDTRERASHVCEAAKAISQPATLVPVHARACCPGHPCTYLLLCPSTEKRHNSSSKRLRLLQQVVQHLQVQQMPGGFPTGFFLLSLVRVRAKFNIQLARTCDTALSALL